MRPPLFRSFWLWTVGLILGSPIFASAEGPTIQIGPDLALMDDVIVVSGAPAGSKATLTARAEWHGQQWESHASFLADQKGQIDVSAQAPISGTYTDRDPMGLFWSQAPKGNQKASGHHSKPDVRQPRVTHLELDIDGRCVATAECPRWYARPGVQMRELSTGGLVGHLYVPSDAGKHPAVLVLGGSEGGQDDFQAALLASHGYASLALAYFGARGLPTQLVDVPLLYFEKAISWLAAQPGVDASHLGVYGGSKGAELALLLASRIPQIKAVVAVSPSNVVWEGIGGKASSWSYQNHPLPYVRFQETDHQAKLVDKYRKSLAACPDGDPPEIPVERIKGAVLLLSGRDDQIWPAAEMAEQVLNRLRRNGFAYPAEHLCYEKAGHTIPAACIPAFMSVQGSRWPVGGSAIGNAKAQSDSRHKVLEFLKTNLG